MEYICQSLYIASVQSSQSKYLRYWLRNKTKKYHDLTIRLPMLNNDDKTPNILRIIGILKSLACQCSQFIHIVSRNIKLRVEISAFCQDLGFSENTAKTMTKLPVIELEQNSFYWICRKYKNKFVLSPTERPSAPGKVKSRLLVSTI